MAYDSNHMEPTPILRITPGETPTRVLVVGDPDRAARVAERLDQPRTLGKFREYHSYAGFHRGVEVAVSSHGVGAPGAALCFEEWCQAGATRMIRAGTCGGLQPEVTDGDLVIATGAVRRDGLTDQLVPPPFPALAGVDVVAALRRASRGTGVYEGVVLTEAVFYSKEVLGSSLELWQRAGVVAVEMECAALFVIGSLNRVEVGAILAADGNPLRRSEKGYDPHREVVHRAVDRMIGIALDALVDNG